MDKATFIRTAPAYYELAVALALRDKAGFHAENTVSNHWASLVHTPKPGYYVFHLRNKALLRLAISNLEEVGAVETLRDTFGPSQIGAADGLGAYMDAQRADKSSPLFKCEAYRDQRSWVIDALSRLNDLYINLGITDGDWVKSDKGYQPVPPSAPGKVT